MRFSVTGNLAEAVVLLRAVDRSAQHSLASGFVEGPLRDQLAACGLPLRLVGSAEDMIVDAESEAVIVAADEPERAVYLARQASQAGSHVIVIPPAGVSTAFSYELHLLLDESQCSLVILSGRWYLDRSAVPEPAAIRQLSLSLPIPATDAALQQSELYAVDAVSSCGFRYSQVTALDVRASDQSLLSRTITLSGSEASEQQPAPAILKFSGTAQDDPANLQVTRTDQSLQQIVFTDPLHNSSDVALSEVIGSLPDRLVQLLSSPERCQQAMEEFSNTLELMGGIEKSLRRRRTVDVYFEGVSERGIFKSQMTAIGCGVLAYVLLGMMAFLIIAQLTELPRWLLHTARILWVAPVVVFLVLQFLLPITRHRFSDPDR